MITYHIALAVCRYRRVVCNSRPECQLESLVYTAPLSRSRPLINAPYITLTLPPRHRRNPQISTAAADVATVLISEYLLRWLIRPLIRPRPRNPHYRTGR